jgi:hypothetical protein
MATKLKVLEDAVLSVTTWEKINEWLFIHRHLLFGIFFFVVAIAALRFVQ